MSEIITTLTEYSPLEMALAAWLDAKSKRSGSAKTLTAYREAITSFRATLRAAGLDLDVDPRAVALLAQGWAGQPFGDDKDRLIEPATYNQRLAILSSFYRIVSISWGRKLPQSLVQFKALLFNKIGLDLHFELNRSKLERN